MATSSRASGRWSAGPGSVRTGEGRPVALPGLLHLHLYDGEDLYRSGGATQTRWWDAPFGDTASTGGLRLVGKDLDGDSRDDLVLSHGTGGRVTTIRGALVVPGGPSVLWPGSFVALSSSWVTAHGLWVG